MNWFEARFLGLLLAKQQLTQGRTGWLGEFISQLSLSLSSIKGDVRLAAAPAAPPPSFGTWQEEELHTQQLLLRAQLTCRAV